MLSWLVIAVVVVLVTWLVVAVTLLVARPRGVDLAEAKRFVPDVVRLLRAIAREPQTRRGIRIRLALLIAYLASPIDLVPDFVPVLGYADDVILVALVLRSVVRRVGPAAVDAHWTGTPAGLEVVRRLAGLDGPKSV